MRGHNLIKKQEKGKIIQLEEMSWKQVNNLNKDKTIFFIPISPMEEHGPHLPVGTDFLTSRDTANEAIKEISKKKSDYNCVLFPPIPLGFTKMASDFPGTVSVNSKAIKIIIYDVISSIAKFGFKKFVICSFHMDLGHLKGIYVAMKKAKRNFDIDVIEPWGPYFFNKTVEKKEPKVGFDTKKEIHAGFRETSLMKYQYPYLVDESFKKLQNIYRELYSPTLVGKTFKDIGLKEGYVGSPARADENYGRWYFQEIVNTYVESTLNLIEGKEQLQLPKQTQRLMKSMFWI